MKKRPKHNFVSRPEKQPNPPKKRRSAVYGLNTHSRAICGCPVETSAPYRRIYTDGKRLKTTLFRHYPTTISQKMSNNFSFLLMKKGKIGIMTILLHPNGQGLYKKTILFLHFRKIKAERMFFRKKRKRKRDFFVFSCKEWQKQVS